MRKYTWIFGASIMVLCIGFGFFLPRFVFSKTLDKTSVQAEKYEIEPVEIGSLNTVINAMRSSGDSDYIFDYQEELANLSREQLIEICNSFLAELKLSEWGCNEILVNASNMKASCYLAVINYDDEYRNKIRDAKNYPKISDYKEKESPENKSEKNTAISSVIWKVEVMYTSDHTIVFAIDDKNRKVIQMYSNVSYATSEVDAFEDLKYIEQYASDVIIPFFKKYYDVDVEVAESGYQNCILRMTDNNDDTILMSVYIFCGYMDFMTLQ